VGASVSADGEKLQGFMIEETRLLLEGDRFGLLPKLLANQLKTGDLRCPEESALLYEACLAYQGAYGIWRRMGKPHQCPLIANQFIPEDFSRKVSKEDVVAEQTQIASPCFGYLYAINVTNVVPILSNTVNRVFHLEIDPNFEKPGSDPEMCVQVRHGICGNQAAVALAFFELAGYEARPVQFFYEEDGRRSHIVPEVRIEDSWRLIDSTYGAFWIDRSAEAPFELSTTDAIINNANVYPIYNKSLLPHSLNELTRAYDPFSYLENNADILRGGIGSIRLRLDGEQGKETFAHLPNYVGDNRADNKHEGSRFLFVDKKERLQENLEIEILVSGSAYSGVEDEIDICIDTVCQDFSKNQSTYRFQVTNPKTLRLETTLDVAYVVMQELSWRRLQ
jgi:hypothetical protein